MFDFERVCGVEAANSMEPWTPFSIIVVFMLAILMVGLLSFRELQMFGTADIKIIQSLKSNECNVYNSCLFLCKLYWQISLCVQKWVDQKRHLQSPGVLSIGFISNAGNLVTVGDSDTFRRHRLIQTAWCLLIIILIIIFIIILMYIDLYWFILIYIDLYTIYILFILIWSPRFVGVASSTRRIVLRRAAETRWFWCRFWMILVFLVDLNGVLMALVFCIF